MAHLFRLIFAAVLAAFSLAVHALVPAVPSYRVEWNGYTSAYIYPSRPEACSGANAYVSTHVPGGWAAARTQWDPLLGANGRCYVYTKNAQGVEQQNGQVTVTGGAAMCPAHSTSVTGGCKCDTGYDEVDGQCKTPGSVCVDKATLPAIPPGITQEFNATRPADGNMFVPRKVCIEQCQASGKPAYWACGGASCTVHFKAAEYTGQPCAGDGSGTTPTSDTKPTPVADRCPDGKVPGTVNGTNVCVTPGSAGSTSETSESTSNTGTNPDGTPAPTTGSGSGSSSSTSCDGTTCTTTTTTTTTSTNGSGQTTTKEETSTKKEPQVSHCAENPKAKECAGNEETKSSFTGACAGGFQAKSDDAVINAMAEETFRQNCKVNPDQAETTLAAAERVKTGNQTGTNPNNVSLSISPASIDTSDAIGGAGGCISDKVLNIAGGTVVLPLSRTCDTFPMLGNLLVAIGFLVAAVIIMRG